MKDFWATIVNLCITIFVFVCRRWQDCNSKWQKFVAEHKALGEWLNQAEGTLQLAETDPAAHRQHLRVKEKQNVLYHT